MKPKAVVRSLPLYEDQIKFAYEMSFILADSSELDLDQRAEFWEAWNAPIAVNWQEVNTFCETYELRAVHRELQQILIGQKDEISLASCQTIDELFEKWGDCARCPLHKTRIHLVKYGGGKTSKVILCGEGPGSSENIRGEPFVGKAGKFLREFCLYAVGLRWEDLHVMNAVCCRPTDGNDNNRAPSKEEMGACRPRLIHQVRIVNPKLVILTGDKALKTFFPDSGRIGQERGCEPRYHPDFPGVPFIAVHHPSYLMKLRPNHSDRIRSMNDWREIKKFIESC
jgi:DNA polymerase